MAIQGVQRFCASHPKMVVAIALGVGACAAVLVQVRLVAQGHFQDQGMQGCLAAVQLPASTALLKDRLEAVRAIMRCASEYLAQ
jgi:hypothetical protein